MPQSAGHEWRNGALLASIALATLLALAATWMSALARLPQQRAAVERLLRAQTGLDVRYGRLVVRLGFYGPEAEFSNVEMRRPGAGAPLLRAPRMVARFESWRLLRGGQLRPGRVLVSGAELDLRQLSDLRRAAADGRRRTTAGAAARGRVAAPAPVAAGGAADEPTSLAALEARLPELLAGIPEGSLDFEAVTLVWTDPARPAEALQLRAPRLYASRRVDGAQLSGTLLLPARFGRTLFVAAQLRDESQAGGLDGRLRVSGRGLVLASWRELGLLPAQLVGGTGDVALAVQLRGGRIRQAEGNLRLAGLGFVAPGPLVARRFGLAAAEFDFIRAPDGERWRLQQVELVPVGGVARPFGERGALELTRRDREGGGTLRLRRLPLEVAALLAPRAGVGPWPALPPLRATAGEVAELQASWPASGGMAIRGRLEGLVLASADGRWRADGVDADVEGEGAAWRLRLEGREAALRAPGLETLPQPLRAALRGELELAGTAGGWSLALPGFEVRFADGPSLRVAGSAGVDAAGQPASRFELALDAPLARASMTLPQAALRDWVPDSVWEGFDAGRLDAARLVFDDARLAGATLALRDVELAADATLPAISGLAADLGWDGQRLDGRLLAGQAGPLRLEQGRVSWNVAGRRPADALEVEAQLAGSLEDALRVAGVGTLPGGAAAAPTGRARIAARLRAAPGAGPPAGARDGRSLELAVDVEDGQWRPVPGAAPLTELRGRLRADAQGLRDGRLDGRWLGGPVQLRLDGDARGELRLAANGRLSRTALEQEWTWLELVDRGRGGELDWNAELRHDLDEGPPVAPRAAAATGGGAARDDAALPWRVRIAVADAARAELRWVPGEAGADWRLDRGIVRLGDAGALAGIPGALVVGGRLERLDLAGLAGALARFGGSAGWQRPLVGEVTIAELALGAAALGEARLRLAGSRESTAIELRGEGLSGELRQVHAEPERLQARFARLRLPADAPLASLADTLVPARTTLALQVADLQRGTRSLGELAATLEADGAVLATRDLALRRGAQRLGASGRCERASQACTAEFALEDAELGDLLRDLGQAPTARGREVAARGRIGWSMQPGAGFAATLQGEVELAARLDAPLPATPAAAGPGSAGGVPDAPAGGAGLGDEPQAAPAGWPLLAPLLATVAQQRAMLAAPPPARTAAPAPPPDPLAVEAALALERLDLRLEFRDGVATIDRYEAVGREARLSVAGSFDFRRDQLEQRAEWQWIAPGVAGAVDRLDPRSPLAAGLRTLRDLVAARGGGGGAAAARGPAGGVRPGEAERFLLDGPLRTPRIVRTPLLDSTR